MATVQLDKNWRITSDEYQWIVQKHHNYGPKAAAEGREPWKNVSFHSTLDSAIKSLTARLVRLSDAVGIGEVLEAVHQIQKKVEDLGVKV